jgi:serpin B
MAPKEIIMTQPIILLAVMGLLFSICQVQAASSSESVVQGSNTFAADLYAKLAEQKGNIFFSPGSIHIALVMTHAGAGDSTARQMAKTLHLDLPADQLAPAINDLLTKLNNPAMASVFLDGQSKEVPAYQLTVANALWGQKGYGFKPDFIQLLHKFYGADLSELQFAQAEQARTTINDWVAQQTKDRIKNLIPQGQLNALTCLVLTNAIYFKSNWENKFPKAATKDGPFKLNADKSVDVPMMHLQRTLSYMENDDLQLLELPYLRHELSMVIILPKKIDGVGDVEKQLTAASINQWSKKSEMALVEVTMPKFTFSGEFMLAQTLKGMGMTDAFDPNKANFSGMTTKEKLCISEVIHKAFIAVDEDGTEAAAATAVMMTRGAMLRQPPKPVTFTADHPFVFLIRHNSTGEILFMGRLANPKGE